MTELYISIYENSFFSHKGVYLYNKNSRTLEATNQFKAKFNFV